MTTLRVLTRHVHGNDLLYLSRARVKFYLPEWPVGCDLRGEFGGG